MRLFVLVPIFLGIALSGCSDQPKQVADRDFVAPNPVSPSTPTDGDEVDPSDGEDPKPVILDNVIGREPTILTKPRVSDNNSEDDKIEENGKQPIIFNGTSPLESSVAGVKFNFSYEEASEVLSTPYVGSCGSWGDYYLENLCFQWTDEEPRRLRQIAILDGYLGAIDLPEPLGMVNMKAELGDVFKPEFGEKGEGLLRKVYNKFFEKEESFNCIETKDCEAVFYNDYINWILPNITLIFSKDRKVLIQMIINQDVQPGEFASPMDLVRGGINLESGEVLDLGEKWGVIQSKLSKKADPPSILETKMLRKDFVGSIARVQRKGIYNSPSDFDSAVLDSDDESIFSSYLVYSNYQNPVMMNGKYVVLKKDEAGKYQVKLIEFDPRTKLEGLSKAIQEKSKEEILTVRMDQLAGDLDAQKAVIKGIAKLLRQEFKKMAPNSVVSQRISGLHAKPAPNRRLVIRTSFYDFDKMSGFFTYVHVSVNSGGFLFNISLDDNPISEMTMPSVKEVVDLTTDSLSGIKLGTQVKIFDIDRKRNEAFIELNGNVVRIEIDLHSSARVSYKEDSEERQNIIMIEGMGGATLGVSTQSSITQETKELVGEITFLSSTLNSKGIKGVCGSEKVFKIGMTQRAFEKQLKKLIKEVKTADKDAKCSPFVGPDTSGDGHARSVYFPNQQTKVYFDENVLVGATKYKKASGGNQ